MEFADFMSFQKTNYMSKRKNVILGNIPLEEPKGPKIRARDDADYEPLGHDDFDPANLPFDISLEDDLRAECQEVEVYMNSCGDNRRVQRAPSFLDVEKDIDPIDPRLPGILHAKVIKE